MFQNANANANANAIVITTTAIANLITKPEIMPIITGLILFGDYVCWGSTPVLAGASIKHNPHDAYNEWKADDTGMLIEVFGFAIMASLLYKFTSFSRNAPFTVKVLFHLSTIVAPVTTAPLLGKAIYHSNHTPWSEFMIDDLIGLLLILGGSTTVFGLCLLAGYRSQADRNGYAQQVPDTNNEEHKQDLDIEAQHDTTTATEAQESEEKNQDNIDIDGIAMTPRSL